MQMPLPPMVCEPSYWATPCPQRSPMSRLHNGGGLPPTRYVRTDHEGTAVMACCIPPDPAFTSIISPQVTRAAAAWTCRVQRVVSARDGASDLDAPGRTVATSDR